MRSRFVILLPLLSSLLFSTPGWSETLKFAVAAHTIDTVVSEVIILKAYEILGHSITIERLPPKRALERANSGHYDGDVQRIHSVADTFPNLIRLEPSINYINGTGFIHKDTNLDITSWQDLMDYKVGIIFGIRFAETNVPKQNAILFYDYQELSVALFEKRIDIGIYPESNGIYQAILMENTSIVPLKTPLTKFELYHYIHNKNAHLVEGLEKIFTQFEMDGTLTKVRKGVLEISFARARNGQDPCYGDYACYQSVWEN